ncbi:MAG: flagellar filament capping protein FliD [Trichloromonas sp.]|jgi:flagellar hook-associated protein 2|nr:flagellar filament capping protein FliD [Trichloromonas sp.]
MSFTLGGLASGMDTGALVDALVGVKRTPILRLEERKTEANARLSAFKTFDSKLKTLLSKADSLDTGRDLLATTTTASTDDYLAATASSSATSGSYQIKVGQLAQVEKSVYQGVADKSTTTFGTGTLQLSHAGLESAIEIAIDESNNTLEGVRDAINAKSADSGVTASIINDGSGTPYRLVLTGKTVQEANITLDASTLTGGAAFPVKDAAVSRTAQQAIVQVDGVTIRSDSNTLTEAIPGVTIDLKQAANAFDPANPDWKTVATTNVTVATDNSGIQKKVEDFVAAFNDLVKASKDEALANDSGVRSVLSNLRSKFSDGVEQTGLYQLGIKTEKDGTLAVDTAKLSAAITDNLDGVKSLLTGDDVAKSGVADLLKESLSSFTNPTTGLLAGRQSLIESSIRRIDKEITRGEDRLALYEEQLVAKFSAMEQMVSSMNSQASYFSQQAAVWSNM